MQSKVIQTTFLTFIFLFFLPIPFISAQSSPQEVIDSTIRAYIAEYSKYAVSEMERTGIPASITLAQGICESRFGTSNVATKAHNHFGIKCYKSWKGKRYFHKDDEYKNGKLVPSCFRYYATVAESYRDHSDFLIGRPWYDKLFKLESNDYKNWAIGLRKAGYAHAADYEERLYKYITKFELYKFDKKGYKLDRKKLKIETVAASDSTLLSEEVILEPKNSKTEKSGTFIPKNIAGETQDTVLAGINTDDNTPEKIELPVKKTEKKKQKKEPTPKKEIQIEPLDTAITFTTPPAKDLKGVLKNEKDTEKAALGTNNDTKTIAPKASLAALGQRKTMQLPTPSRIPKTDAPKVEPTEKEEDKKPIYIAPTAKKDSTKMAFANTTAIPHSIVKQHQVAIGETLYKIARQYNVSLDKICELNHLTINSPISAGQTLVISE